jgi:hypothetical protein
MRFLVLGTLAALPTGSKSYRRRDATQDTTVTDPIRAFVHRAR